MESNHTIRTFAILCILLAIFHWQEFHKEALTSIVDRQWQEQLTSQPRDRSSAPAIPATLPYLKEYGQSLEDSDFVELDHCSLASLQWDNFTSWANPILSDKAQQKSSPSLTSFDDQTSSKIQKEWILELLEMYATHSGLCNFKDYRFRINNNKNSKQINLAGKQLQKVTSNEYVPDHHARIAFVIVAFQDAAHLKRLIKAIHMPHHTIVIHLEEGTDPDFEKQVARIIESYSNVVVVKFGTVIYKTDSVSRINLQIMDWLVHDLQLKYDYHVTLGGAVFPLLGASELAKNLYNSSTNVWLGELTHKGQTVHHDQWGVLWQKRLVATSSKATAKIGNLFPGPVPEWIRAAMQHKSASGNQAIYSRAVVQQILTNPQIAELFALGKYGCCCCIEERIWIAAMDILGHLKEAKENRAMFQYWGGDSERCRGSMQNAVLDLDKSRCYRSESPTSDGAMYVYGNETWNRLQAAKDEGVLFARKFRSNHNGSVALLHKIRDRLHVMST